MGSREDRRLRKMKYVWDQVGRECVWCEATKNLHLDHVDNHTRFKQTSQLRDSSWPDLYQEIPLLQGLCISCHSVKTNAEKMDLPLQYEFDWVTGRMIPKRVIELRDARNEEVSEDDMPF